MQNQSVSAFSAASFQMFALNGGGASYMSAPDSEGISDGISLSPQALAFLRGED